MLSILLLIILLTSLPRIYSENIDVKLISTFNTSSKLSYIYETGEFISIYSGSKYYYNYIAELNKINQVDLYSSQEKTYKCIKEIVAKLYKFDEIIDKKSKINNLINPIEIALQLILTNSIYSPKIAAYQSIYHENKHNCDRIYYLASDNKIFCDVNLILNYKTDVNTALIYDFDHIYNRSSNYIIAYLDFSDPNFNNIYTLLINSNYTLIIRPIFDAEQKPSYVSGYGIELALKNNEYKVINEAEVKSDDLLEQQKNSMEIGGLVFGRLIERHPEHEDKLKEFRDSLWKQPEENLPLWELKDAGFIAAQRIMHSSDPLVSLSDYSQNFPLYSRSLPRSKVDKKQKAILLENGKLFNNREMLFMNGIPLALDINIFDLIFKIYEESKFLNDLKMLGFNDIVIHQLLSKNPTVSSDKVKINTLGKVVSYVNDLEKDPQYKSWPNSLQGLLQPGWPNQIRYVAKNLYNAVFIIDPSTPRGLLMYSTTRYFLAQNAPFKAGFVLFSNEMDDEVWPDDLVPDILDKDVKAPIKEIFISTKINRLFSFFNIHFDKNVKWSFLDALAEKSTSISLKTLKSIFMSTISKNKFKTNPYEDFTLEQIFEKVISESDTKYGKFSKESSKYISDRGLLKCGDEPCLILNGVVAEGSVDNYQELIVKPILGEQGQFQMKTYHGEINDRTDLSDYIFKRAEANSVTRFNPDLSPENGIYIASSISSLMELQFLEKSDVSLCFNSFIITADLSNSFGIKLAYKAVEFLRSDFNLNSRVSFVFFGKVSSGLIRVLNYLTSSFSVNLISTRKLKLLHAILLISRKCFSNCDHFIEGAISNFAPSLSKEILAIYSSPAETDKFCNLNDCIDSVQSNILSETSFSNQIILNGRSFKISNNFIEVLAVEDFVFLAKSEVKLQENFEKQILNYDLKVDKNHAFMAVSAILGSRRVKFPELLDGSYKSVSIAVNKNSPFLKFGPSNAPFIFAAVLNPLSQATQRISQILLELSDSFSNYVDSQLNSVGTNIWLIPSEVTEMPLKRYYRHVFAGSFNFENGIENVRRRALFKNLPLNDELLTMVVDTPESWLVEAFVAKYDLDNIRLRTDLLNSITKTLSAEYILANFLVSGQCFEKPTNQPAAGLQLLLGDNGNDHIQDTVVMANLGYFQLKANPGIWYIKLAEGKHSEIYEISSTSSFKLLPSKLIAPVISFTSELAPVFVAKKSGKETAKLEDDDNSYWGSVSTIFNNKIDYSKETIHVFSLASGHLYERFLKIMMQSVIKNTKNPVKFWFIANFLSPQFKKFVPKMAKELGFQVEFVTYKWPAWLRRQSEKQRTIWGYKILFLDVLFPLKVKKIIFVDADQVVRGDLRELIEMDLQGAPYAYTPFCDSNGDTEGFRFWKQGFWRDHLRGKPYHISALYVVDLEKFRKMKAGDSLRSIYDNLSSDPNSLANLDQDLPNYAQNMVPIFSLPQQWLFCATWCSMDDLTSAKTIDLCNNPMTKEPKIDAARRIIKEWTSLDENAKSLEQNFPDLSLTSKESVTKDEL